MVITQQLLQKNINLNHAGIDEAGRGAIAGPVIIAAIMLTKTCRLNSIKDSKQLSKTNRELIYQHLVEECPTLSISVINEKEIDKHNILQATLIGMKKAIKTLEKKPELCLIDGNKAPKIKGYTVQTVIKGDQLYPQIAAASIIAKVTRDRIMNCTNRLYSNYHLAAHKGYGTKKHYQELKNYGPCRIHRKTFTLKK
ncbi:MAG: ribonuclease HII [bacterium]